MAIKIQNQYIWAKLNAIIKINEECMVYLMKNYMKKQIVQKYKEHSDQQVINLMISKKVILFIVEGITDEISLGNIVTKINKNEKIYFQTVTSDPRKAQNLEKMYLSGVFNGLPDYK